MRSSTSRQLPTGRLSPLPESDHVIVLPRLSDELEELNNSSVIPVDSSKICNGRESQEPQKVTMTSYHQGNYVDMYATRRDNSTTKTYIESCSGRKHEDTEVLKQKYINSEIRDLPGKVKNAFHHRRLLKTRSTHSTTGTPDLKNHQHKMHLKSTLKTGTSSCENLTPKQRYRCRKLSEFRVPTHIMKRSMAEILYGDKINDDTDAEIAALFEDYVEECEHIAKTKPDSNVGNIEAKEGYESFIHGSVHAFLCGFIEEMHRDNNSRAEPVAADDKDKVQCNDLIHDKSSEHDAQSQAQRDLISNNQDLTHKHLRLWEMESRDGNEQKTPETQTNMSLNKLLKLDIVEDSETQHTTTPTGDRLDMTSQNSTSGHTESNLFARNENVDESGQVKRLVEQKIFSPGMREKSLNQHKYKAVDLSNLREEDINIVRLAKQKLEQRLMASFAMDEAYLHKLKSRSTSITNDLKPGTRRNKTNDGPNYNKLYKNKLEEFEGWDTFKHGYDDHDNLESSEFLHPIESFDKLHDTPMWTPSSSTPLLYSPIDSTTPARLQTSRDITPDVTMEVCNTSSDSYYPRNCDSKESGSCMTKSSKYEAGFSNDYTKAARFIKLRLTKSNDLVGKDATFVDKSFVNVPLSPCINYNIENNMRANVKVTTSINLSEKLAQQLREMSQNDKHRPKGFDRTAFNATKQTKQSKSTIDAQDLPSINGDSINTKTSEVGLTSESTCSFPEIHSPSTTEAGTKSRKTIPRQQGNANEIGEKVAAEDTDLPSISVKAFANNASKYTETGIPKHCNDEQRSMYGGVAVRAGVCTSPYKFDKQDPNMLRILKARPLPGLHSVCTSCGGVSEKPESPRSSSRTTTNIWRKKSDYKLKEIHKQCCGAHAEDKWKLDRGGIETEGLPKVAVEKMPHSPGRNRTPATPPMKPMPSAKSMTSNMMLGPTSKKQNCEEMSINFMDRNIKFRFQREETLSENADKTGSAWLKNISAPTCRDRFECPVTSETRIYKDDIKRGKKSDSRCSLTTPVSSPYLDYCKHKAELRALRQDIIGRKLTGTFSDIKSSAEKVDQKVKKTKTFPVLPIKKSKEKSNRKSVTPSCNMFIIGKTGRESRSDLFVKPSKPACLPEIKSETFAFSKENTNNNVVSCIDLDC